jgi:integrase
VRSPDSQAAFQRADALRDGLCHHNPFTNLRLETPNGRKDITALTEAEIEQLAEVAREHHGDYGDEIAALIVFAAYTGVRPGELAALRWNDLDIPNRRATISRALDGQGGIKPPKNGKPRRIVLPPQALRALSTLPRPLDDAELIFHTPHASGSRSPRSPTSGVRSLPPGARAAAEILICMSYAMRVRRCCSSAD